MKKLIVVLSIIFLSILLLIIGLYFYGKKNINADTFFSRRATHFFDYNTLIINSNNPSHEENISIYHSAYQERKLIYDGGKNNKRVLNEYGRNYFDIYYNEEKIITVDFYQFNNWQVNSYVFYFTIEEDLVLDSLVISNK